MKQARVSNVNRRKALLAWALLWPLLWGLQNPLSPAIAQDQVQAKRGVLTGDQVSVSNLIKQLKPTDVATSSMGRTRGIRVERNEAAPRRDASLLVTFITNSATLTARAKGLLDVVGQALNSDPLKAFGFVIEGHSDPRGNAQSNLALSEARAQSVRNYLIDRHRVSDERLVAIGKGDVEPLDTANPAAPANRRVTIVTKLE